MIHYIIRWNVDQAADYRAYHVVLLCLVGVLVIVENNKIEFAVNVSKLELSLGTGILKQWIH